MTITSTVEASLAAREASLSATAVLKRLESVVLFVPDIDAAARWYAEIFGTVVQHENAKYAFIQVPGLIVGFHPADVKCPGGVGGTTAYWEVERLDEAVALLIKQGAKLFRGPGVTNFGASIAMLIDPFGCTIGLNQSTERSRRMIHDELTTPLQHTGPLAASRHTR
ncbi:MAG: VOC family protein [Burkholderiaceae bacterium]